MDYDDSMTLMLDDINLDSKGKSSGQCQVCGIDGAQYHYGGLCCVSCKMFFRRNSKFDLNSNDCVFKEKCDITINSRRACRYCRLLKCLAVGMQRELLRASHHHRVKSRGNSVCSTSVIPPLDLLNNDRSLFTDDQKTLVTNVIQIYDTKSPVNYVRQVLTTELKHPVKLRLKMAKTNILEIITSSYKGILPFFQTIPEFQSMQPYEQCELMDRNLVYVGAFNAILVFRDAEVPFSTAFKNGFPSIYGTNVVDDAVNVAHRTDKDVTLIKLLIPILMFSTSYYLRMPDIVYNDSFTVNMNQNTLNTKQLFHIQNIYVEIMFKYMIYRFGYQEATLRFAALIKSFLDQSLCVLRAGEVQSHDRFLKGVNENTSTALDDQDEMMD